MFEVHPQKPIMKYSHKKGEAGPHECVTLAPCNQETFGLIKVKMAKYL